MLNRRQTQPLPGRWTVRASGVFWITMYLLFACSPGDDQGRYRTSATGELTLQAIQPASWTPQGGIPFSLTGQGFRPGAEVFINGQRVTDVSVVDLTHITGIVPASPDAFDFVPVEVRNADGARARRDDLFSYVSESAYFTTHSYFLASTATSTRPIVAISDLNRDQDPDLVAASGSTLQVFRGSVDVEFVPSATLSLPGEARGLACVDLDSDGWPDCIVALAQGASTGGLRVLRNLPSQGLIPVADVALAGPPEHLALVDLDHDNRPDVVVTQQGTAALAVLLGTDQGWLAAPQSLALPYVPTSLTVADLTADGNPDMAITATNRTSVVLVGNGRGGFAAPASQSYGYSALQLVLADLNRDLQSDLIANTGDRVSIWLASGAGTYSASQDLVRVPSALRILAADVDRDGVPELVSAEAQALRIDSLTAGGGTATQLIPLSNQLGELVIADFDQDSWLDVAVLRRRPDTTRLVPFLSVLRNVGGTWTTPAPAVLGPSALNVVHSLDLRSQALVRDVNGDERADLVTLLSGEIITSLAAPPLGFRTIRSPALGGGRRPLQLPYSPMAAADVNGDGRSDLAVALSNTLDDRWLRIAVLFGDGQGRFVPSGRASPAYSAISSVWLADVDGNSSPDLIVQGITETSQSDTILVYPNDGQGQFPAIGFVTSLFDAIRIVAVSDVNADGRTDLLTVDAGTDVLRVRLGDGKGSFTARWRVVVTHPVTTLGTAELNGDGLPDLLVAGAIPGADGARVSAFLGRVDGSFAPPTRVDVTCGAAPRSLWLLDVNGDRRDDVVLSDAVGQSVCVLLADGTGSLRAPATLATAPGAVLGIADAGTDRRPDLWFATGSGIVVLENHAR